MGCTSSSCAADDSPIVSLCRERLDLIRSAAARRYALASAHSSYFRSLPAVADALHRFAVDELSLSISSSPLLAIPSTDGKRSSPSPSSISSLSHSLSPEGSHIHISSSDSERKSHGGAPSPPPIDVAPNPNYYYLMRSPSGISTVIYEDQPYAAAEYGNGYDYGYGYGCGYGYGYSPSQNAQIDAYERATPPPPPPAQGSSWDFFNPFYDTLEQDEGGYYPGMYGGGSVISSPNSSEVREQEGIPDLEEDSEQETELPKPKGKGTADDGGRRMDFGAGTSKALTDREKGDAIVRNEKEINASSSEIESDIGNLEEGRKGISEKSRLQSSGEEDARKKKNIKVSFDGNSSVVTEESGLSNFSSPSGHRVRSIMEVVDEINERFRLAADCGDEVSGMLEVGRMRYQPTCGVFRVMYSWFLDLVIPSILGSYPALKLQGQQLSGAISERNKSSYADIEKLIGTKSGCLSGTMEKLYVWEKRLFKEVKDEEKLRIMYDKQCKQLKALDDRGAESHKLDATRASIKKLTARMSIVIKSIKIISSRIHKIRDEELQPQIIELIQGLIRMWKSVLDCHQKQFQVIVDSKSYKLQAKTGVERNSVAKATRELEMELLNWCSCFNDWISTQKGFVESLNGWLMKWLLQEQEVTPDGVVPFSPGRIGAPAAFIISNDWYNAITRISETEVTDAMRTLAASVHNLWVCQEEEYRQKLKAEYMSRDFSTRLKSLQKEDGISSQLDPVVTTEGNQGSNDVRMSALNLMRKRLDEEIEKHVEAVKQVQEAASFSLKTGLTLIFEALGNFCVEMIKAYEVLRIQK